MNAETFQNMENSTVLFPANTPQYFFDDTLIAHHERIQRVWEQAKLYPKPVLEPETPWDSRKLCLFGTIVPCKNGGYRMYYANSENRTQDVLLAESSDGFRWTRPILKEVNWNGFSENNVVLKAQERVDSPSVIYEPDTDPVNPYKMILYRRGKNSAGVSARFPLSGLFGYTSSDGIHWTQIEGCLLDAGDRTNIMPTRPNGKYVVFTRSHSMMYRDGIRTIYRSESEDFLHWSSPKQILKPDLEDGCDIEFYGMSAFERHNWQIGLIEYWNSATDTIEVHLAVSRDGITWIRPSERKPFIPAIYPWNLKWNSCASNGPIIINEQMVFYFGAGYTSHHFDSAQQYSSIGFSSLPLDRFCAMEACSGGLLVTPPIQWPGGDLVLNTDTRESYQSHPLYTNGDIIIEVLDEFGTPIEGYSADHAALCSANTHQRGTIAPFIAKWRDEKSLNEFTGKSIRLAFKMRHAKLYTLEAQTRT